MEYQPPKSGPAGTSAASLVGFGLLSTMSPLAFRVDLATLKLSIITGLESYYSYENGISAWDPSSQVLYGFAHANSTSGDIYAMKVDVNAYRHIYSGRTVCTHIATPPDFICPFNFFYV
jgi:hypothetical protein